MSFLREVSMNKENARTRRKLKEIETIDSFRELIDALNISDEEKTILELYYLKQKSITYIADALGMSESTVKRKHSKVLKKIGRIF